MSKPKVEPPEMVHIHDSKVLAAIITAEIRLTKRVTVNQIAQRTGVNMSFVKNSIQRLQNKDLIKHKFMTNDGVIWHQPTPAGYKHAGVKQPMWMEA